LSALLSVYSHYFTVQREYMYITYKKVCRWYKNFTCLIVSPIKSHIVGAYIFNCFHWLYVT